MRQKDASFGDAASAAVVARLGNARLIDQSICRVGCSFLMPFTNVQRLDEGED